jgi:hypothetical protein
MATADNREIPISFFIFFSPLVVADRFARLHLYFAWNCEEAPSRRLVILG